MHVALLYVCLKFPLTLIKGQVTRSPSELTLEQRPSMPCTEISVCYSLVSFKLILTRMAVLIKVVIHVSIQESIHANNS